MSKQKLPKHIIAFESGSTSGYVVLKNKETNLFFSAFMSNGDSLRNSVEVLNRGSGLLASSYQIGKQIVF